MLTSGDAAICRWDSALPTLRVLLDDEALAEALAEAAPDAGIERVHVRYVRYKPGTNCIAAFAVQTRNGLVEGYAKAFGAHAAAQLARAVRKGPRPGPLGAETLILRSAGMVVRTLPADDKLGGLSKLLSERGRRRILNAGLRLPHDFHIEPIQYKPERRFVARVVANGAPLAAVKLYTERGFRHAQTVARTFTPSALLPLAPCVGASASLRGLLFRWLPGQLLNALFADPVLGVRATAATGSALAVLHESSSFSRDWVFDYDLIAQSRALQHVLPDIGRQVADLAQRAHDLLARGRYVPAPIHGDFYAKQVIASGERVSILDLDRAAFGDPAMDLGLFVAHLERDVLRGSLSAERAADLSAALLAGYADARRDLDANRVRVQTVRGLLSLTLDPFRHREPNWEERTRGIVQRAAALLNGHDYATSGPASVRADSAVRGNTHPEILPNRPLSISARALPEAAFHPGRAARELSSTLGAVTVQRIRVPRLRAGRRAVIEYRVRDASGCEREVMGKIRAKGADLRTLELMRELRRRGFGDNAADGIMIPEPLGAVPALAMVLQEKVEGTTAATLLDQSHQAGLGRRLTRVMMKLHRAGVPSPRTHGVQDELAILHAQLDNVVREFPQLIGRVDRLFGACVRVASTIPSVRAVGIHRDFYPDQVLIYGARAYLLDLDLYTLGDPALDAGNLIGHITELALRTHGHAEALREVENEVLEEFARSAEQAASTRKWALLTLARQVAITARLPQRRSRLWEFLAFCESRFDLASRADSARASQWRIA